MSLVQFNRTCPSQNTEAVDQSSFWSSGSLDWDEHRIGWAIAGGCSVLTVLISMYSVLQHCRYYNRPNEQRQILRVLYMPPVYAIISFFSYRYFRSYTYYSLIESVYEAVTLSAFVLLLIEFVADTAVDHSAAGAMERKNKRSLPFPFCCWRFRPTKAYFMYTIKWSVLQYVIIRPAQSIAGIICEAYNVLCDAGGINPYFAYIYLEIIDFVSISVALYGLILFYALTKDELVGRRPLAKFLSIKLIVMFTFYQSFVFSMLEGRVIKSTEYWTATNIADGLTALATCIEMVFFSAFMCWAYTVNEYKQEGRSSNSIWRPLWDSINYTDFAIEIFGSLKFYVDYARGKPSARSGRRTDIPFTNNPRKKMNFGEAFGVSGSSTYAKPQKAGSLTAPYPYQDTRNADSSSPLSQ
ncbi:organic solute transporter Ostalpha-domain-containing protein [Hygrophoropsis aurantiaca]|uniref:Organic solute transporter Ostalpha-domain-containing protein n=1 Tax=Hygrophoropsis aurantiaca TaxID=72124 RepID=A0ACB8ANG1_9AGAM|nr:organic solute transporter Ostalpha-domain-containing protein [Hygrophoropsis aurantiaca]